jgi:pantoate--beta-alanine ligase
MKRVEKIEELRNELKRYKDKKIALVPTMGYLHEGHLLLVKKAREVADIVVMSIFVNPIQFGPNEDFDKYPRNIERDEMLADSAGVDYIFYPEVTEMYNNSKTFVDVLEVSEGLCGGKRPGHFRGVATVVLKLFNIVKPDYAVFGIKDAQQVRVIEKMVEDLNVDIKIIRCEIKREESGLAMSSRNKYLSVEGKENALIISKSLKYAQELIKNGERSSIKLKEEIKNFIKSNEKDAEIDYIEIVNYENMKDTEELNGEILIAEAVYIENVRLIDNCILKI